MNNGVTSTMEFTETQTHVLTHEMRRYANTNGGGMERLIIEILHTEKYSIRFTFHGIPSQYWIPPPNITYIHDIADIPLVVRECIQCMNTTNVEEVTGYIRKMMDAFDTDKKSIVLNENSKTDTIISKLRSDLENAHTREKMLHAQMEEEIQIREKDSKDTFAFLTKIHREELEKKDRQLQETILLLQNQNMDFISEAMSQLKLY